MDKETLMDMIKDYRVALYLVLLIASIIVIFPHPGPSGLDTNLQFGLDLDGGSWIQLEFQSAIVTFKSDKTLDQLVPELKTKLDAEVNLIDQNTLEIRSGISEEELRAVFAELDTELVSFNPGVTKETADDVKRILENKINSLGTRDAKVYVITALNGISRYIRIEMAGVSMGEAQEIVGKQGKFEIRHHTS
jgi:preprotein translocase subunit SecD